MTYSAAPKVQDALINGAMKLFPGSGDDARIPSGGSPESGDDKDRDKAEAPPERKGG